MLFGFVLWEICIFLWRVQNLLEKWQMLDWSKVTLIERSSSWKRVYKYLRCLSLVLRWSRSMTSKEYKVIWLWSVLYTHFVLKLEDQDQTQDEVEVSRLLIKLSPSLGSINQVISSECQEWFIGERSLLPSAGAYRLCVGKLSVVLERLIWKWWSEEHLRCLVEAIKRVDQEKQATPKKSWQFKWYSHL